MTTQDETEIDRVREHWDQRAVNYTETANKRVTIQCARQLYNNMQLDTATTAIEVAAGAGICAKDALNLLASCDAARDQKKRFLVTDLSPVMVDFAKTNLSGLHTEHVDVQVQEANGQDLVNVASGSMDRYIASMCLHLCPDPDALLREARRVLKSDGTGLAGFTIWGRPEFSGLFAVHSQVCKELGTGDSSEPPNFAMGKDLPGLRQKFAAAGFSSVQIWPFLCVVELWSDEDYATFYDETFYEEDEELRKRRHEVVRRLADEWLAKGFPIGLEAYIIVAKV